MKIVHSFAVAAVLATGFANAADAAVYNFSYRASTFVLAGQLEGTLQPDNNTVLVSSILGTPTIDAVPVVPLPFVTSLIGYITGFPQQAFVTLDGSAIDMIACTNSNCVEGFLITTDDDFFGGPTFSSNALFGGAEETYIPANWSLSLVPEPATWGMLVAGFGILGLAARRRRAAIA